MTLESADYLKPPRSVALADELTYCTLFRHGQVLWKLNGGNTRSWESKEGRVRGNYEGECLINLAALPRPFKRSSLGVEYGICVNRDFIYRLFVSGDAQTRKKGTRKFKFASDMEFDA